MATTKRVYWDSCAWIALIQKEKIQESNGSGKVIEDRFSLCMSVIKEAEARKIEIATSAFTLAEVCRSAELKAQTEDTIVAYFENDYLLLVNVDSVVGERARGLMMSGIPGLKPPDAVHLATALVSSADAMHTFDDKLLKLDGTIDTPDGKKLTICKPDIAKTPAPLLAALEKKEHGEGRQAPEASKAGE